MGRLSRYRNLSIVSNDLENGESVFLGHRSTHGHRDIHFYRNLLPFSLLTNTYPVLQLALQFPNIQLLTLRDRRDPPPLRHHRADIHLSLRTQSISPLASLDLILIKKYAGVPVPDIRRSGGYDPLPAGEGRIKSSFLAPTVHRFSWSSPLQITRALPRDVPSSRRIVLELMVAFFLYDTLFFLAHIALHRIPTLRRIHHPHHTHSEINPQVTNQLTMIERLSLILLANFSLNIIGSHVLTRTLFVPIFVYMLVEIHCGMDLEWGYEKIMPFGLGAGCRKHAMHHRLGEGHYQQFFTWWDDGLVAAEQWLKGRK